MMKKLLWLMCILIMWINGFATDYYFSSSAGNDLTGTGSVAFPWASISKFNSVFPTKSPGDNFLFLRGDVWTGTTMVIGRAGTSIAPMTIGAYGNGADPLISGFVSPTSWSSLGNNIWESNVLSASALPFVNMVTINGINTPMGRIPNTNAAMPYYIWQTHAGLGASSTLTSSNLNAAVTNWATPAPGTGAPLGAEIAFASTTYIWNRFQITAQTGSTVTYNATTTVLFQQAQSYFLQDMFIQNDPRTLDVQDEWYYNPSTKRIRIYSSLMPTNVKVAAMQTLLSLPSFRDFVTIDRIDFEGCNGNAITAGGVNHTTVQNCKFNFIGGNGYGGGSFNPTIYVGNIIKNCYMSQVQNMGIDVYERYAVLSDTVKNVGMIVGMHSPVVNGNGVSPNSVMIGIRVREDSSIVYGCVLDSIGLIGIRYEAKNNCLISYNFLNHTGFANGVKDDGAIYTHNSQQVVTTGTKIFRNILVNVGNPNSINGVFFQGIYFDFASNGIECYENTVEGGEWGIDCGGSTYNINVHDNTTYNQKVTGVIIKTQTQDPANNFVLSNNKMVAKNASQFCLWVLCQTVPTMPLPFTSDNNYFARPIDDNLTIQTYFTPNGVSFTNTQRNLPQWRTLNGTDANSHVSPRTITNLNQLRFEYNGTMSPINVNLGSANYVDVTNLLYTGTITLQPFTSLVLIASGTLITPTITWPNPAAITYPAPLTATQLNATSGGVPGTFTYTPVAGTVLDAGTQTLSVLFTPTDGATYTTATKNVTIVVNKAVATLSYSNLTQTYTGSPLQPTVTTSPAGLTIVSTTYNGVGSIPTNAASYAVVSGLSNANYTASPISGTFTINKATATINISNLSQTYDGTQKAITASTSPVGLSGLTITYNGSATVPTNAGSYTINVTLNNTNYTATPATGTLVISKATPTVSWSNPIPITYPAPLSGTQLNATASVAGAFTYTPPSGTVLNAGSQTLSVNFVPTDNANYNSVLNTTVTIIVNKGTATVSLSNLAQTYDGTSKSAIVTTNPVGLNVVTITYDGSATLPINASTYAVVASLNNSNYTATNATGNLVISKAVATLSLSNTSYTYDGTQKSVTVTTAPAGLNTVSITYNGSGTSPTNAGSYTVVATLSNANYTGSTSGTLTINKGTPNVSWSTPAAITYPTPLSGTQLNALASVPGTFAYTPVSGTVLNAGTYTLIANFTPTDGSNYNSVNGTSVSLIVNKATATISLSNLAQDFDGNPKPVTVTTNPVGLGVLTITYDGSATVPSAIGSYNVNVTLSNNNYTATPATGVLVISATAANIFITNTNQTYTGSPLPVTVTTSPPALAHTDTYNGSGTVPTNAGTYTVIATLNSPNVGADTATYIIAKANPVITWANPSAITYGTALNGTQLNASASVSGTLTYTPASGTILNAGTQILSVGFVPTDAANYNSIPATTVSIVVNKAVATLTLSNLNQAFDGTPKSATVTSSPVGLTVITTTYDGSTTPPTAVGSYAVSSTLNNSNYTATPATGTLVISTTSAGISISNLNQIYTGLPLPVTVTTNPSGLPHTDTYNGSLTVPTNVGSYTVIATLNDGIHTGADTQTLIITKATPIINWSDPTSINYGTALSSTQLNASTSVAGTFVYTPTTGAVLNVGTQSLSVVFTPTDAANYNTVTKIVSITVNKASAGLSLSNLLQTYNTLQHPVLVTSTPAGLSGITVTYNGSATPPTNAGSYAIVVTLVNDNYTATPINGTLVVSKAIPILAWALPVQITYGTPLSSTQLNATSNIAGTFAYTPSFGAIVNPGTSILTATFTPTDATNYATVQIFVPLSVSGSPFLNFVIIHNGSQIYENLPE